MQADIKKIARQDREAGGRDGFFVRRAQAMSPAKKRAVIRRDHPEPSINQRCTLVRISRSAFYCSPVGTDADILAKRKEIDRVFPNWPFFHFRAGGLSAN